MEMQKYVAMFLFASIRLMITLFLCNLLFSFQDESRYKNLLQDLAQREGYGLQTYCTEKYGEAHAPIFVSTVEIEGEIFTGAEAKTKKQAEMSAAKTAYTALKQRMYMHTCLLCYNLCIINLSTIISML